MVMEQEALVQLYPQDREGDAGAEQASVLIHSRTPAHGMVPITLTEGLSTSINNQNTPL